jgi:alkylhydroperoxidase/carboxymuconolactone decarboxylase family protein YurZ
MESRSARDVRSMMLGEKFDDAIRDRETGQGPAEEFTRPLHEYALKAIWGGVWSRTGLDIKTRSLVQLAILTAQSSGTFAFETHFKAARRNGCSLEEIQEVLLHTAIYCGVERAANSFQTAARILASEEGPDGR